MLGGRWHNPLSGTAMRIEHRTNAAEQAMAVVRHLLDPGLRRLFAPVPYFWSDQYAVSRSHPAEPPSILFLECS